MRLIADLLRTFGLGLLAFVGSILALVLFVAAIPLVIVYAGFAWMGLVSLVAFAINPTAHHAVNAAGFLGVAAVMCAVAFTLWSLPGVFRRSAARRREQDARQALARVGGLRLMPCARFNAAERR